MRGRGCLQGNLASGVFQYFSWHTHYQVGTVMTRLFGNSSRTVHGGEKRRGGHCGGLEPACFNSDEDVCCLVNSISYNVSPCSSQQ